MKLSYYSLLNEKLLITETSAVLAIVRMPEGELPEHAIILVESINPFGNINLAKYHLVMDRNDDTKSTVLMSTKVATDQKEAANLLFNVLLDGEKKIAGKTWSISKDEVLALHQQVLNSKQEHLVSPQNYNVLGEDATLPKLSDCTRDTSPAVAECTTNAMEKLCGSSGNLSLVVKASLSPAGESCYTWARNMLYSIDNPTIKRELPRSPLDLIANITSYHLSNKKEEKTGFWHYFSKS